MTVDRNQLEARIRDLEGELEHLRDIEECLARSQRTLKQAEALAKLGHWSLDIRTGDLYWSDEIFRIFGIDPERFGASYEAFLETIHPDDRDMVNTAYSTSVENRTPYDIVHRLLLPDGTIKHVHERCETEYDDEGTPLRSLGTVHDITEQRRAETALRRIDKLESLGGLAGGIAHDFNNILVGILGNIDLVLGCTTDCDESPSLLADAKTAALRARDLAAQLLTFAKGGEPVRRVTDVGAMVNETCRFTSSGSEVACDVTVDDALPCADVDAGQISQVVQNLVINAQEALAGSGRIEVRCHAERPEDHGAGHLPPGEYVVITVSDRGPGIPAEILGDIFDPFFTSKTDGTGLGLSISHSIVARHGGWLDVRTQLGEGTSFDVWLPACEGRPEASVPEITGIPDITRSGRILVMDDQELVRTLCTRMVESLGFEVESCESGECAVKTVREAAAAGRPFDAVILDLTVPDGLDGAATATLLREESDCPRLIASSGYSDSPVMADCRSHGFDACFAKPYDRAKMAAVLDQVLSVVDPG